MPSDQKSEKKIVVKPQKMANKVTSTHVMWICAAQILIAFVGMLIYKKPHLWAYTAISYWKNVYCGSTLAKFQKKYDENLAKAAKLEGPTIGSNFPDYLIGCTDRYLENFNYKFTERCMNDAVRWAFTGIPVLNVILLILISFALHKNPFNSKTLMKPPFLVAVVCCLLMIAVNIVELVSILMPLMNPHTLRVPEAAQKSGDRERCGYAAEIASSCFIGISAVLSGIVTYYLVHLYTVRIRYQDQHVSFLVMEPSAPKIDEGKETEDNKKENKSGWGSDYNNNNSNGWGNNNSNENKSEGWG